VNPRFKYKLIDRHGKKYPISEMCHFFKVSRSGYYDYLRRKNVPNCNEPLAEMIAECQKKHGKIHGYRYVHLWLQRRKGIYHDPKTVLRVMQKYGLLSEIRRRRKYQQMGQQLHRYENLLNRDFTTDRPNSKWVTDISYIHTAQGVLYLSMIRDLYDNSIVAYRTGTEQTANLVLNTIKAAVEIEKVAGELHLHSDQGFQYTSHAYFTLTKEYGITPSMSRRGNCYDNAVAENFFSILKTECIYRQKLKSFTEARERIDEYIYFYNNERFQLKNKMTPFEKRRHFA